MVATLNILIYKKATHTLLFSAKDADDNAYEFGGTIVLQIYRPLNVEPILEIPLVFDIGEGLYVGTLTSEESDIGAITYNYHAWQTFGGISRPLWRGRISCEDVHTYANVVVSNSMVVDSLENVIEMGDSELAVSLAIAASEAAQDSAEAAALAQQGAEEALAAFDGVKTFGDVEGGNYSEFEADGTLKFHGNATVFRDEMHTLIHQSKNNNAARMVDNIAEGSLTYKSNATVVDYAIMSVQLNHDRKNGADVYPHLHWWQTTINMPNWLLEYRWQRNGQAKVTAWTELAHIENAFTWVSGTLNQITRFTPITPPSGDGVSDVLQIRLSRDVAAASTIYTVAETSPVDQDALSLDVHIEIDTIGSRQEYIK